MTPIPVSVVIATKDRAQKLANLFASLRTQDVQPAEIVVVDASADAATRGLCEAAGACAGRMVYRRAEQTGAAVQRNEGVAASAEAFVVFMDDDVVLEPGCLRALWDAMQSDARLGGVNANATNQQYQPPGRISHAFYTWLNGGPVESFAGRVIGPAVNFLPDGGPGLPEIVSVEWLNTTCVLYRRDALPHPSFHAHFEGYSLGEDLALSLTVARRWRLANARPARIFHDTGAGRGALGGVRGAAMELINRHFIMTEVMGRRGMLDHARLLAYEAFSLASVLRSPAGWRGLPANLAGKIAALPAFAVGLLCCARRPAQWLHRAACGIASRLRNLHYRICGVRFEGYCWLRDIRIPRQWEDIRLGKGAGLDHGVVLLCSGPRQPDKLVLGRDCYVNRYTVFDAHEHIAVGARVMIGPHCYITDADHSFEGVKAVMDQPMRTAPVVIGDEAWLGAHVVVLPGVRIGRGAVIGAGSIVNKDIPDNAIALGAPARVVRRRE